MHKPTSDGLSAQCKTKPKQNKPPPESANLAQFLVKQIIAVLYLHTALCQKQLNVILCIIYGFTGNVTQNYVITISRMRKSELNMRNIYEIKTQAKIGNNTFHNPNTWIFASNILTFNIENSKRPSSISYLQQKMKLIITNNPSILTNID